MASPSSPTARRYELARRLRDLRLAARKSTEEVARELECSTAKVSRIETGQRSVQALDIKVLSRFYGVPDSIRDELMTLAVEARRRGWWQDFRSLDEQTQTYIGLESAADTTLQIEILRVPGLLQTRRYMRSFIPSLRPPGFLGAETLGQIVEARLKRQERLLSGDLELRVVIDEAVFARRLEPPEVMREQVEHLLRMVTLPNVRLQVLPFAAGPHPGLDGSFQLLLFANDSLQETVYIEGQYGQFLIRADERPEVVSRYRDVHTHVSQSVALSESESHSWLHRRRKELTNETVAHADE
jgi:transcriptional regulator with XRE-family HTH domain